MDYAISGNLLFGNAEAKALLAAMDDFAPFSTIVTP